MTIQIQDSYTHFVHDIIATPMVDKQKIKMGHHGHLQTAVINYNFLFYFPNSLQVYSMKTFEKL